MNEILFRSLGLLLLGLALMVAEIFLPSYGVLTVLAVVSLIAGVVSAFSYGTDFGYAALLGVILLLPMFAWAAIKIWPRTFVGRRIAPPNEEFRPAEMPSDTSAALRRLIGQTGRSLTPLRPVGTCDFGGRRVECLAESGMIDREMSVVAIEVQGQSLVVRPA